MDANEVIRYEQFCQFKAEIRSSRDYLIVGIDVAKDRHHAFFGTATGRTLLRRLLFDNNQSGFKQLLTRASQLQIARGLDRVVYGLEPTGNYHKPLSSWLLDHGKMLVLVSSKAISDNRETLDGRWDKNDTKDSANVADLIAQGKCQFFEMPDSRLVELRNLLSLRRRLKRNEHAVRMQIRNGLVCKYFPELDRHWGSCLAENLAIVRWCLDPRKITAMGFEEFVCQVTRRDRGIRQQKRLEQIFKSAAVSIGCPMDAAAGFEAQLLVERHESISQKIEQTEIEIKDLCDNFPAYRRLLTIPGFGPYVTSIVLARIGDPHRFICRRQVIRLGGLDLNANRSGKRSHTAVPVISKRGNSELRYALYQAAQIATYHNDQFRALFTRYLEGRESERGIKTKMRVKLAAKMLVIAWTMMKTDTDFDPLLIKA
ncbi:MAG: IS110 family transposase [Thermodesulfobacteriota bacterium]